MWNKQTNRNFIERLFRALFFQKSPNISLNSLFHNSVCLCGCVQLSCLNTLVSGYDSLVSWWRLVLTSPSRYLVGNSTCAFRPGISSLVSLVPLDLASVGKVPSLPSSLRKISWTETGFQGPCQQSVDSTGWSEIVQLIQDEVEAKYDRRIFFEQETVLKLA